MLNTGGSVQSRFCHLLAECAQVVDHQVLSTFAPIALSYVVVDVYPFLCNSIMLASKFFDDVYYNNAYYARVGGISNAEV